ncbi:YuzB family protein [Paenibacillus sp. NPDC058071]|uniref:YuzB family protein n=1 Tax=Paenibacillus sp. NPDC058071 TaxID=3346326 RepID=UPI0036DC5062
MSLVEFCAGNMHHGTERVMQSLERHSQVRVVEYGCLGNCGECYLLPYALVDGTIVSADDINQLNDKIMAAIAETGKSPRST